MKLRILTWTALAALGLTLPVAAGEKCKEEASVCLQQMVEYLRDRGWVGIEFDSVEEGGPPQILRVLSGSPAEEAGFEVGDVLVAFNGVPYKESNEAALKEAKKALVPGNRVTFRVSRQGREIDIPVVAAALPRQVLAQWVGQHMLEHHVAEAAASEAEAPKP